ncbi:MAG: hypothetical protein GY795_14330 [Desulfobacterales bacterium]|nr:hypothetical protein [Desulfobacterales bacterium]
MSKDNSKKQDLVTRIEDLKRQVEDHVQHDIVSTESDDCPMELQEKFWEYVLDFEKKEYSCLFDVLTNGGLVLPPPDELDDEQLTEKLWELIQAMALLRFFLYSTDHLSDRELYEHLWNESLSEDYIILPATPSYACHIDLVSNGSEEANYYYLKYYADEEDCRMWAKDFPDYEIPPREPKPYDRDRHLPKREGWG